MTDDPYAPFASYYDLWSSRMTEDVEFYVRRAREDGGPIVELGAGTGRIAIPTAQEGVRVIAVDTSEPMLEVGRRNAEAAGVDERITWVNAPMQAHVADPVVGLVTIPFRAFLHLMTLDEQLATLAAVHRSLRPGGLLVLNMFVPDPFVIVERHGKRLSEGTALDEKGRTVEMFGESHYDVALQRMTLRTTYELSEAGRVIETGGAELEARLIWPAEMRLLLERSGFEIESLYGWFDERPFTEESREMIWVARKP